MSQDGDERVIDEEIKMAEDYVDQHCRQCGDEFAVDLGLDRDTPYCSDFCEQEAREDARDRQDNRRIDAFLDK